MTSRNRNAFCSFCRKSHLDVGPLVEGPGDVYICGECTELCQAIIDQEKRRRGGGLAAAPSLAHIEEQLGHWFPGQHGAMREIATLARGHCQRLCEGSQSGNLPGANSVCLAVCPTHGSKLFLARVLGHILDVPVDYVDASSLHARPAHDMAGGLPFYELLQGSNESGVLYIDRVDQEAEQPLVLQLLEGRRRAELVPEVCLDISRILVLCGGEFPGLDEAMARRGRHAEQPITSDDLTAHGMLPTLAGRFLTIVRLGPLADDTVSRIVPLVDLKSLRADA
jgi:ATP-dependent Clp protease ATP-binding subunit ClpX